MQRRESQMTTRSVCCFDGYGGHEAWNAAETTACNKHNKNNEWKNVLYPINLINTVKPEMI